VTTVPPTPRRPGLRWRLGWLACLLATSAACRPAERVSAPASVDLLVRAVQGNDGQALWNHLPSSMKVELGGLLQALRRRLDPPLATVSDRLLLEAAEALSRQQALLPEFASLREGMTQSADRRAFAHGLATTLRVLAPGALALGPSDRSPERVVEDAGPPLLTMLVPALRAAGSPLLEAWRPGRYRVTPLSPGKATLVRDTGEGRTTSEVLVLVDGRWIPERWVIAWRGILKRSQALLKVGPDSPLTAHTLQIIRLVNQTRARLPRLARAGDQAAFDKALSLVAGSLSLALTWASWSNAAGEVPHPAAAAVTGSLTADPG
jgi:hypothetical protein